jgi:hypothetical protein
MIRRLADPGQRGARPATDDDEARWAQAQALLDRPLIAVERRWLRRRWVILWSVLAVVLVLPVGVGVLLVVLGDGGESGVAGATMPRSGGSAPGWRS